MSTKMQIRLGGLTTVILAFLALAPIAQARPDPGSLAAGTTQSHPQFSRDRAQHIGMSDGTVRAELFTASSRYRFSVPDRGDGLVASPPTTGVVTPPDRADKIGGIGARSVPNAIVATSGDGFNWSDAMLGAIAALGAVLLTGLGVMLTRRHGGVAQPS